MGAPATIVCVDCGGTCHLLTEIDRESFEDGVDDEVIAVYRCEDCNDRWDVVLDPSDLDDDDAGRPD